jgi:hypothetical protein
MLAAVLLLGCSSGGVGTDPIDTGRFADRRSTITGSLQIDDWEPIALDGRFTVQRLTGSDGACVPSLEVALYSVPPGLGETWVHLEAVWPASILESTSPWYGTHRGIVTVTPVGQEFPFAALGGEIGVVGGPNDRVVRIEPETYCQPQVPPDLGCDVEAGMLTLDWRVTEQGTPGPDDPPLVVEGSTDDGLCAR